MPQAMFPFNPMLSNEQVNPYLTGFNQAQNTHGQMIQNAYNQIQAQYAPQTAQAGIAEKLAHTQLLKQQAEHPEIYNPGAVSLLYFLKNNPGFSDQLNGALQGGAASPSNFGAGAQDQLAQSLLQPQASSSVANRPMPTPMGQPGQNVFNAMPGMDGQDYSTVGYSQTPSAFQFNEPSIQQKAINTAFGGSPYTLQQQKQAELAKSLAEQGLKIQGEKVLQDIPRYTKSIDEGNIAANQAIITKGYINEAINAYNQAIQGGLGGAQGGNIPTTGLSGAAIDFFGGGKALNAAKVFDSAIANIRNNAAQTLSGKNAVIDSRLKAVGEAKGERSDNPEVIAAKLGYLNTIQDSIAEHPDFMTAAQHVRLPNGQEVMIEKSVADGLYNKYLQERTLGSSDVTKPASFLLGTYRSFLRPDVIRAYQHGDPLPIASYKDIETISKETGMTLQEAAKYLDSIGKL
jgi:hypothetical protein